MVVLTIITIISAIILTSQGSFNKTLILANTAYDMALTLRFTETYGLGSRAYGTTGNTGYGLHFVSGTPKTFTLFADTYPAIGPGSACHPAPAYDPYGPSALSGDCAYSNGEKVQDYTIGNSISISYFCAQSNTQWFCTNTGGLSSLDIVFSRPNPTPFMSKDGMYSATFPVTAACIALTSTQGGWKYVTVGSSGQISTNATTCP